MQYLFIESRSLLSSDSARGNCQLAKNLAEHGNSVTYFLIENGVFPSRKGVACSDLEELCKLGASVLVDEFSLNERGIFEMADELRRSDTDTLIDLIAAGYKPCWH